MTPELKKSYQMSNPQGKRKLLRKRRKFLLFLNNNDGKPELQQLLGESMIKSFAVNKSEITFKIKQTTCFISLKRARLLVHFR